MLTLDRTLNLAPMMGCTDRHFRVLARLLSPHALLYSEMVTTGALLHGDAAHHLQHRDDAPAALQLGGNEPQALSQSAVLAENAGYSEVNLNVGCPSDRVKEGAFGACLMARPELVADCLAAMQGALTIPVTIKCRIGIDNSEGLEFFLHFVDIVRSSGCRVFAVHARKALLKGLSPKENREIPPLHYDYVEAAIKAFPELTFILNGGLKDDSALDSGFDGVMLGREAYNRPWVLAEMENRRFGTPIPDPVDVFESYLLHIEQEHSAGTAIKHMARHLFGFFLGQRGARLFRRELGQRMVAEDATPAIVRDAIRVSGVMRAGRQPTAQGLQRQAQDGRFERC